MPNYAYIPRMQSMGGNPWQSAANAYASDLDQYNQIEYQGMNERANAPSRLYNAFMQSYQAAQDRRAQEEAAQQAIEFRDKQLAIQQQREDERARQDKMLNRMTIADRLSKNLDGTEDSYRQAESILSGSGFEGLLPKPTEGFNIKESSGDLLGTGLPVEPGSATPEKRYPVGTAFQQAKDKLEAKAKEAEGKIFARFELARMKSEAAKDLALDPRVPGNQEKIAHARQRDIMADVFQRRLDAGDPEAAADLKRAQAANAYAGAGLAGARTGLVNEQVEAFGQPTERDRFIEAGKKERAGMRASGAAPIPPPRPQGMANPGQSNLEKAKAEFNALPVGQRTPENKKAIASKYGISL